MKMQKVVACVLLLALPALATRQLHVQKGPLAANSAKPEAKPATPAAKVAAKPMLKKPVAKATVLAAHKTEKAKVALAAAKPVLTKPAAQAAVLASHDKSKTEFVPNTSPVLVPESDKLFFGKDYPTDERPAPDTYHKMEYPFPKVQKPDVYDKDYVKDENADNGEWKTQTDYDFARADVVKQAKEREAARKRYEKEHGDAVDADAAVGDADAEWKKAHDEAAAASEAKKNEDGKSVPADNSTDNSTDKQYHTGVDEDSSVHDLEKALAEAEANYAREQEEFKKCQQELEDSKIELDKLKALQAATALHAKEFTEQRKKEFEQKKAEHAKKIAQQQAELDKEKAAAASLAAEADKKVAGALKKKQAADQKLAKEKLEDQVAKKTLDKEEADLKKAEEDLENAAKKLRHGGKGPEPSTFSAVLGSHSGAAQVPVLTPMLLAMTVAIVRVLC